MSNTFCRKVARFPGLLLRVDPSKILGVIDVIFSIRLVTTVCGSHPSSIQTPTGKGSLSIFMNGGLPFSPSSLTTGSLFSGYRIRLAKAYQSSFRSWVIPLSQPTHRATMKLSQSQKLSTTFFFFFTTSIALMEHFPRTRCPHSISGIIIRPTFFLFMSLALCTSAVIWITIVPFMWDIK